MRTRGKKATSADGRETLADISMDGVDKFVRRANARGRKANGKQVVEDTRVTWNDLDDPKVEVHGGSFQGSRRNSDEEKDDIDWEDGSASVLDPVNNSLGGRRDESRFMTIEFSDSPDDSSKRKPIRRATAEEKELAELVHKVHLLCLLARGRIIDSACDDPLIQASLLSLLPAQLLKISGVSKLSASILSPLVSWFHNNFHVRSSVSEKRSFQSALAHAIETREGTPEEIAALSVALFRALNLTTRFVSILDVASRKPGADKCESCSQGTSKVQRGIFNTSTLMVDRQKEVSLAPVKSWNQENYDCEASSKGSGIPQDAPAAVKLENQTTESFSCEAQDNKGRGSKRKCDMEFEMQLQMALSATAVASPQSSMMSDVRSSISDKSNITPPLKKYKLSTTKESPSSGISTAIGSRKIGSPLYWAEVFCSGETLTGRWVHVDAVNAIVDGEQKVEAAAAACRTSLRYVVAFAGHGAKDVTRRYCMKSYKTESQRINSVWWDAVLAPLRELESGATGGRVQLEQHDNASNKHEKIKTNFSGKSGSFGGSEVSVTKVNGDFSGRNSFVATRSSLEDMELETRALTEPLPTNQQAYKNHQLYAIERWLTKYQMLHPRGPILGFCSGHLVYPRTCVQTLKTKDKWLREGLQVKANESPAKLLKQSGKIKRVKSSEDNDCSETNGKGTIELYGKWQLEPLKLPHAVNGIVPKNERGQVDVWSEKCLPPGTVHLRLRRVFQVAKRLGIDYAAAMVGFDFRNGRSVPVFDGIVVCTEFKDAILEAYGEEEEIRMGEEKKRNEAEAVCRWYQLVSSIITRQRLNNCYGNSSSLEMTRNIQVTDMKPDIRVGSESDMQKEKIQKPIKEHEHVFVTEEECFDEESWVRRKRCHCGFSIQVEDL
ncbi:DNA repair protein RAD4 isoform X2 [Euphorbia lathyris]|uniref:DNA repair protein RAD4 isoform X2 n=1 Tax=Euphorbia lathyris TaxID=212925 RepID=UPI0033130EEE